MKRILKKYFLVCLVLLTPYFLLSVIGCDNDTRWYGVITSTPTIIQCSNNEFTVPKGGGGSRDLHTIDCPSIEYPLFISSVYSMPPYTWENRAGSSSTLKAALSAPVVENWPARLKFYDAADNYYETPINITVTSNFSLNATVTPDLELTGDPDLRYDTFIDLMFAAATNRSMQFLEYFALSCDVPCAGDETTVPDSDAWVVPSSPVFPIRPWQIGMNGLPNGKDYTAQVRAVGSHINNEAFSEEDEKTVTIPIFSQRQEEFDLILFCNTQTKTDGTTLQVAFRLASKDSNVSLDFSEFTQPRFYLYQGKEMVGFVPDETMFKRNQDNGVIDLSRPVAMDVGDHGIYQVIFAAMRNNQPIQLSSYFRTSENIESDRFSGATCEPAPPIISSPPVASFTLHDQLEDNPPFNIISVDGSASKNTVTWRWDLFHRTSALNDFLTIAVSGPQTTPIYDFDKITIEGQFQVRLIAANSIGLTNTMWWPETLVRTAPPNSPHADFTFSDEIATGINRIIVDGTTSQNTVEWNWTLSYKPLSTSDPLTVIAESGSQNMGNYTFDATNDQQPLPEQGYFEMQLTVKNSSDISEITDTTARAVFRQ
ncbi:MAG: hypothetical protein ACU85E_16505 [Gammaproteobacteria bacterium]